MRKREIKKTVIQYQDIQDKKQKERERQRSRQKQAKAEIIDAGSRRARLAMMKNRRDQQQVVKINQIEEQPLINLAMNINRETMDQQKKIQNNKAIGPMTQNHNESNVNAQQEKNKNDNRLDDDNQNQDQEQEDEIANKRVMLKPVFISKEDREEQQVSNKQKQEQRKKKALRYTTKLLLLENAKGKEDSEQQIDHSSDEQIQTNLPDDDDTKNEQLQYELWKVRQLKRIRRDRQERRLIQKEKAQIERRRKMNNEEILLENKVMGSDATDNATQTKYVFMQKYYHKGAFYQDSQDPIFKRDYNLPTPLEMQDKSMLPQILQRRQGNFGKKGQSKYKHLTAQDTTNFDPQYRPDESILAGWKKKMAGYKGAGSSNI